MVQLRRRSGIVTLMMTVDGIIINAIDQ